MPHVVMRLPNSVEIEQLASVAAAGVHHAHERPFLTPWAEGSPTERAAFVRRQHWLALGSWRIDSWSLGMGVFAEGVPVGIVTLWATDFVVVREVTTSSWLGMPHQAKGWGTEARAGLLSLAFDFLDAYSAVTEVFQDNHASQRVSRRLGYASDGISLDRRGDDRLVSDRLRLTTDSWNHIDHLKCSVEGFEACRTLFGL